MLWARLRLLLHLQSVVCVQLAMAPFAEVLAGLLPQRLAAEVAEVRGARKAAQQVQASRLIVDLRTQRFPQAPILLPRDALAAKGWRMEPRSSTTRGSRMLVPQCASTPG